MSGRLQAGPRGLDLGGDEDVPAPDTVRDAVLMSASPLSDEARAAVEAAAVAGQRFDLHLAGRLASEDGLAELQRHGILRRVRRRPRRLPPRAEREAFYADVPWLRRRALHRQLAEALEAGGGQAMEVATHWLGARDAARARAALRARGRASPRPSTPTATRPPPAARRSSCGRGDEDPAGAARGARALRRAAPSWRASCPRRSRRGASSSAVRSARGERLAFARRPAPARRRLRAQGRARAGVRRAPRRRRDVRRRRPARRRRARAARDGQPPRASAPTTARRSSSRAPPAAEAGRPERVDLRARALGLEGVAQAKRGEFEAGLETVRDGLAARARARPHRRSPPSSTSGSALVLYDAADYRRAEEALDTALGLCRLDGDAEHRGRLRHLPRLRAARARRVGARPASWAAS